MTLDEALKEVQGAYPDDKIAAGIQLAWLPDTEEFYAAVHQFPTNVASRRVVAKARAATSGEAISELLRVWRDILAAVPN